MTQLQTTDQSDRILQVLVAGNLSVLTAPEKLEYYHRVCESLDLNPLTKPFEFITLNGKLVLYALKGATDQLRDKRRISIDPPQVSQQGDMYIVTVTGIDANGRRDSDMGVVAIGGLKGENLANAMLKAVTKAKRRLTLSMCGLGMLDETEIEDIPASAKRPPVTMPQPRISQPAQSFTEKNGPPFDAETGEVESEQPAPTMWAAFWEKARTLGYDEAQVREFVGVDPETFDAMTRDDLLAVLKDLKSAGAQPSLV